MGVFRIKMKKVKKRYDNKSKKIFPIRKSLFIFLPILIIAAIVALLYALSVRSSYFIVRDVIMVGKEPSSTVNYADLEQMIMDKNIFKLNLKDIRNYMLESYPELLNLRLERTFPDSVIATITLRKPVAQLYQERYYPVDENGIILSNVTDFPDGKLPIINGIRSNLQGEVGKATDFKRVKKALLLLKDLKDSGILDRHTLIEIDISSLRNVIFFLEDGLEVKIGHEDYASRLENLKKVLSDPKIESSDIRYIDLRFKEPVIGPKWKR